MRFVKCDKCGTITPIGLSDSDYVCFDEKMNILDDQSDSYISEVYIGDKYYDICNKCYSSLRDKKKLVEKEFIDSIESNTMREED